MKEVKDEEFKRPQRKSRILAVRMKRVEINGTERTERYLTADEIKAELEEQAKLREQAEEEVNESN